MKVIIKLLLCVILLFVILMNVPNIGAFSGYYGDAFANNGCKGKGHEKGQGNNCDDDDQGQCLKRNGKGHTPRQAIIIDNIMNMVISDVVGGDDINKTVNVTYSYDRECVGVICSMPSELTFYSRASSHSFTVNAELNDATNCSSFRIFGVFPVDSDNSAKYRVLPVPEITISYIPYNDGGSGG